MSSIPVYKTVYAQIKKDIKDGIYPVGSLLPTESEFEEKYNVSRTTIRKVISLLTNEGYLRPQQGRGTEVMNISTTQKLNKISSITETLTQNGYTVTTRGMCITKITAPKKIAESLHLNPNESVFKVERVQCADNYPIALMTNYLKASMVPNLDLYVNTFSSLYKFLEEHYHIALSEAEEYISAVAASFTDSQILQVPVGYPLLLSKRITLVSHTPFEYAETKLVSEKYEYCVYLSAR